MGGGGLGPASVLLLFLGAVNGAVIVQRWAVCPYIMCVYIRTCWKQSKKTGLRLERAAGM